METQAMLSLRHQSWFKVNDALKSPVRERALSHDFRLAMIPINNFWSFPFSTLIVLIQHLFVFTFDFDQKWASLLYSLQHPTACPLHASLGLAEGTYTNTWHRLLQALSLCQLLSAHCTCGLKFYCINHFKCDRTSLSAVPRFSKPIPQTSKNVRDREREHKWIHESTCQS